MANWAKAGMILGQGIKETGTMIGGLMIKAEEKRKDRLYAEKLVKEGRVHAAGVAKSTSQIDFLKTDYTNAFEQLKEYQSITNDWIFGYLSYDLKNDVEPLKSENFDGLRFPDLYFFQPKKLFFLKRNSVELHYLKMVDDEMDADFETISNFEILKNEIPLLGMYFYFQYFPFQKIMSK